MKSLPSRIIGRFRETFKKGCARFVASLFRSRTFSLFGIPTGIATTDSPREIYPKEKIILQPPMTIDSKLRSSFQKALEGGIWIESQGVISLSNAIITKSGGVLNKRGELITTYLQPIDGKSPRQNDLFKFSTKKFSPNILKLTTPVVALTSGWQGAFYHWMHEVLPRLHLLEKNNIPLESIYIENHFPFQKEALALLGINSIINAAEYDAVAAPKVILPSIPEIPTSWGCKFLRKAFIPKLQLLPKKRLYISRKDAGRRRVVNEEEIVPLLKNYRFELITLTTHALKEQMELFYSAEVIVGPHGAGFSHLVFSSPRTQFLEFFSPSYLHPCYWHLSCQIDIGYHYLLGEEYQSARQDPDIIIDPEKLLLMFKKMNL